MFPFSLVLGLGTVKSDENIFLLARSLQYFGQKCHLDHTQ